MKRSFSSATLMDARLSAESRVVLTELNDGTGLLLHLGSKLYFTLNRSGVLVWKSIVRGGVTRANLVDLLVENFETTSAARVCVIDSGGVTVPSPQIKTLIQNSWCRRKL